MDIKLHQLETIPVRDAQGKPRIVKGYERLARVGNLLDERAQWEPTGVVEYRLDDGEPVTMDRHGQLRGATTGQTLQTRPLADSPDTRPH